jgi:8-oxo-dGTP pyrophosphatase MutT (NUDIX family)
MAQDERSAGMIVVHCSPAGRGADERFLLLDYGAYWDYPKGHVEAGDKDDLAAAMRELREETGIDINVHDCSVAVEPAFKREIVYYFRSKRGLVRKTVVFFLARAGGQRPRVALSHEHAGFAWLPYPLALERLTYASAKDVLRSVKAFLDATADA